MEIAAASERTPTSATTNHNSTDATTLSSARVKSGTFDSGSGSTAATSSSTASLGLDKMSHPLQSQAESQDDTRTECETPVSSPEREMIVTRKMKQDQDQVQTRRMVTRSSSSESSGSNHRTGEPQSSKGQGPDGDADQDADNEADTDSDTDQDAAKEQKDVDFSDWPMENVKDPGENDVLYGRGGGTNHHEGNKRYRKMVERRKVDYVNSKRLDKPLVALDIIRQWREQKPPGRFLKFDEKTDTWSDVGDKKAREKTSQALREKAPLLRKQQEEQRKEALGVVMEDSITSIPESGPSSSFRKGGSGSSSIRQTRFDVPLSQTPKPSKKLGRARLARDHSLGVDFAGADEPISIQGFSWDNSDADPPIPNPPDNEIALGQGWERDRPHDRSHNNTHAPPHRSNHYYGEYYNHSSHQPPPLPGSGPPPSISNVGREQSLGGNPLPLATTAEPAPSGSFEEDQAQYPSTPMNSHTNQWSDGYHPHPPPHPHSDEKVQEAWAKRRYGDNDQGDYRQTRSADHHNYRRSHANMEYNTNQWRSGNDRNPAYDSQYGSSGAASGASGGNEYMNRWEGYRNGYYYPPEGRERHRDGHRDRMYNHGNRNQGQAHQQQWGSNPNSYGPAQENYSAYPDHGAAPQAHPYPQHHDGSFGGPRLPSSSRHEPSQSSSRRRGAVDYESTHDSESSNSPSRSIPRPQPIKRDTSHQNENTETKSQIKRMNRQRSIGSSSRRQNSMSSLVEVSEMDMRNLGRHLRQSSIGVNDDVTDNSMHPHPLQKPAGVSMHERKLTIDQFDLGEHIEGKASPLDEINNNKTGRPNAIDYSNRGNSVESIKLDEVLGIMNGKPSGLGDYDRMGTFGSLSPTNPGDSDAAKIAI